MSREYTGPMPANNSFWYVRLDRENFNKKSKQNFSGVFVVEPLELIDHNKTKIYRLLPGMYDLCVEAGVIIIRPKSNLHLPWIMQLELKRLLLQKHQCHAILIDLSPEDGIFKPHTKPSVEEDLSGTVVDEVGGDHE